MLRGVALALAGVVGVPLMMVLFQDSLIFHPQPLVGPGPASRPGLEAVEIAAATARACAGGW